MRDTAATSWKRIGGRSGRFHVEAAGCDGAAWNEEASGNRGSDTVSEPSSTTSIAIPIAVVRTGNFATVSIIHIL